MAPDSLDIDLFIEEVHKRPVIWRISSEEYRDQKMKKQAWIEICKVFYSDFEEKSYTEKNEISQKLMSKWRNIKDTFSRCIKKKLKSGEDANGGRAYIYGKQLAFLLDSRHSITTKSIIDKHKPETSRVEHNYVVELINTENPTVKRQRKDKIEECLIQFMNVPEVTCPPPQQPSLQEEDDDRYFFQSLLPAVRLFDVDQKLAFRSEILKLIISIRNKGRPEVLESIEQSHNSELQPVLCKVYEQACVEIRMKKCEKETIC